MMFCCLKHIKVFMCFLILLSLSGCFGYRFAKVTRKLCDHPNNEIIKTERIVKSNYSWSNDEIRTEYNEIKNRVNWNFRINPLHWHNGEHTKCKRCGQKFCEHWRTRKIINKIEVIK